MKLFDKIEPIYFIKDEFNTNKDIEGYCHDYKRPYK